MKKLIFMCALFLAVFTVKAQSIEEIIKENGIYSNKNGVVITEENYNKVKDYYSEEKIDSISKQLYEVIENSIGMKGYDEKTVENGYINQNGTRKYTTRTYNRNNMKNSLIFIPQNYIVITESKRMELSVFAGENDNTIVSIENNWKSGKLPKYRSYDVFAIRWTGGNIIKTDFWGEQDYGNAEHETVYYDNTTINKKDFSDGVGLSQNLVDGATSYYQFMNQQIFCTGTVDVYGTYQHAQADVTLEQSKSYNLSSSGMGGVINFYNSVAQYYDNTPGLHIHFTC